MRLMKRVAFFDMGFFPGRFGFTNDPDAFAREMKRRKVTSTFMKNSFAAATTHTFDIYRDGQLSDELYIVTLCPRQASKVSRAQVHALLAHEAVHVWQNVRERIGEKSPGRETEAYAVQHITQCMLHSLYKVAK